MRNRFLVVALSATVVLFFGGAGIWLVVSGSETQAPSSNRADSTQADASSGGGEATSHELPGCPIRLELGGDFREVTPEKRRGVSQSAQYVFASIERKIQVSIACRIASHNVEEAPSKFLSETTERMERLMPGETPDRTRISAGPVPGWRFTTIAGDKLLLGNVLARGVRVVLVQVMGRISDKKAIEGFSDQLLAERIEWTLE